MRDSLRIGIDIGGTFTDFVIFEPKKQTIKTLKLLSTPEDPSAAVLDGLRQLLKQEPHDISIIHGSTVATNTLLERKGAITALITTAGFRDVLQIGRQNRLELYDFFSDPPPPLVPHNLRYEVTERVDNQGQVVVPLETDQIDELIYKLNEDNVEAVAVCLLFSFANSMHENFIAKKLRDANFVASVSCEVLPEFREYERTSTTVVNAYVSPILDRYLEKLESGIKAFPFSHTNLSIMQSNGGVIGLDDARRNGVRCILSGPAGGVTGSEYIARQIQEASNLELNDIKIITFDMGGTSTDVSLIDGTAFVTTDSQIGGYPIRIPMIDIHTIGAGGGSIASVDMGGAMRVGPESAGSHPGPACYGLASNHALLPTVTDANLILGRVLADKFLDGKMKLERNLSHIALAKIGKQLEIEPHQVALGIIEITNAHMERALRVISVERGYDPKDFTLLAFGGAGGQHASELARRIGIPRIIIPPQASTLSAFGMLAANIVKDYVITVMLSGDTSDRELYTIYAGLIEHGTKEIVSQGITSEETSVECSLDLRYKGQSYELTIPYTNNFADTFHKHHHKLYGYSRPEAPLEIVNLRVKAIGKVAMPRLKELPTGSGDPERAILGLREVVFEDEPESINAYWGERLRPKDMINGPALIIRPDTTILIGKTDSLEVDFFGNYIIKVAGI